MKQHVDCYYSPREALWEACESPIEMRFLDAYHRYLHPDVKVYPQRKMVNPYTWFRLDFVLAKGSDRIAIECDGKPFHNPVRDGLRDALILGSGLVQGVMRFPGWTLAYTAENCVCALARYFPGFFSGEGRVEASRLAEPHVRELLDPPVRSIRCDIRESSFTRHIPPDTMSQDFCDPNAFRPFEAECHSFEDQGSGCPDLERVYKAILLSRCTTFTEVLRTYGSLSAAEADYERRLMARDERGCARKLRKLRLADAEYRMYCHFVDNPYPPASTEPAHSEHAA
jgi:hypothetical protein